MNREILFRGKTIDGDWEEGDLIHNLIYDGVSDKELRIGDIYFERATDADIHGTCVYKVIPETVGQFTGLTDKNGKKIFEGDIVRTQEYSDRPYSVKRKAKRFLGVVEYYENKWHSTTTRFTNHIYNNGFRVKILEDMGKFNHGAWSDFWDCEVIGNIHDNPELLEV